MNISGEGAAKGTVLPGLRGPPAGAGGCSLGGLVRDGRAAAVADFCLDETTFEDMGKRHHKLCQPDRQDGITG